MSLKENGPGVGGATHGAGNVALEGPTSHSTRRPAREAIRARVLPDGEPVAVRGREAQTLRLLLTTGAAGFTSGEASPLGWARRTSHYVMKLRRAGFPILSHLESTPDGARVARYALGARVELVGPASVGQEARHGV